MNAKTINDKLWVSRCMDIQLDDADIHISIHEGEKGGKNIQMEKIERTDTQTDKKNNEQIGQ